MWKCAQSAGMQIESKET